MSLAAVALVLSLALVAQVNAAVGSVHRCTDASGALVFSDRGCAQNGPALRPTVTPQQAQATPLSSAYITQPVPPKPAAAARAPGRDDWKPDGADRAAAAVVRRASGGRAPSDEADTYGSKDQPAYAAQEDDEEYSHLGPLFYAGALMGLGGYVSLVIIAFQESAMWGVLVLLFSPLAAAIFKLTHKGKGRIPSLIGSIGIALAAKAIAMPSTDSQPIPDRPSASAPAPAAPTAAREKSDHDPDADCARMTAASGVACAPGIE